MDFICSALLTGLPEKLRVLPVPCVSPGPPCGAVVAFPGILHIRRGWFDRVCFAKPHQNPNRREEEAGDAGKAYEKNRGETNNRS